MWWTEESTKEFKSRTQCFVKQYGGYSQQGVQVINCYVYLFVGVYFKFSTKQINGQLTLGENIADNGGIHTAFQAYRDMGTNISLPILTLTNDQIFFVSFGQVRRVKFSPLLCVDMHTVSTIISYLQLYSMFTFTLPSVFL